MKPRTLLLLLKQGLKNVLSNRLMAIASTSTVIATLFMFGLLYSILLNTENSLSQLNQQVQIVAYLDENIPQEKITEIQNTIQSISNVDSVKYISKEEGLEQYKNNFKEDSDQEMRQFLDSIKTDNPIPATFEVQVNSLENIAGVNEQVKTIEGIYKVRDGKEVTQFLLQINKTVKIVGGIILAILGITAIFIISNTIKLTVFVRRREINIMKYIGATDWFIRWPFIMEGLVIGLIGAIISLLGLGAIYSYGMKTMYSSTTGITQGLSFINPGDLIQIIAIPIIIIGICIGVLGSGISMRRYLKV